MKDSSVPDSLPALLSLLGAPSGGRALVVEDETHVREGLASALSPIGYEVDAWEGIARSELPLTGFDLAFLDHYFLSKTLNGVLLAGVLRASCPSIRIVAMSSDAGKNAEMVRMGADLAVPKSAVRKLL